MDKKRKIEVIINGQPHIFVTNEKEEYIQGLADYLNEKISEVTGTNFGNLLPNDKKYIVAAMNILDDYYKILSKYEQVSGKGGTDKGSNKETIKEATMEYEKRIKALQKENSKLSESLESIEYELKYVQNLYKEQKQEYEQLLETATKPDAK